MSEAYRNFAAVVALLEEQEDVYVQTVDHEHDYRTGDSIVRFSIGVAVPAFERAGMREDSDA